MADLGQQPRLGRDSIEETSAGIPRRHIEGFGNLAIVLVSLVGDAQVEFQPPLCRRCAISKRSIRPRSVPAVRSSGERPVDRAAGILLDEEKGRRLQIGTCSELVA